MITAPTQKLYFNKFMYAVKFDILGDKNVSVRDNLMIKQIKKRLKDSGVPHRTRIDWNFTKTDISISLSAYINDDKMYEELMKLYPQQIKWTSKPISDKHKHLLQDKVEILIREKLLYNRFKYKVIFKTGWNRRDYKEIHDWIFSTFEDRKHGKSGDFLVTGYWIISLYLTNNEDLMHVRMCLSDNITNIIRIDTLKEHGI